LVPTSVTLNDLERRNNPNFAFFSPNSIAFEADYVTVVEERPIMSVNIVSQFHSSSFGQKQSTLQLGFSAIAALLVSTQVGLS